eukprot:scaffold1154_cov310-Pinguiococcus_pyrenoidosus.AAC.19
MASFARSSSDSSELCRKMPSEVDAGLHKPGDVGVVSGGDLVQESTAEDAAHGLRVAGRAVLVVYAMRLIAEAAPMGYQLALPPARRRGHAGAAARMRQVPAEGPVVDRRNRRPVEANLSERHRVQWDAGAGAPSRFQLAIVNERSGDRVSRSALDAIEACAGAELAFAL